MSDIEKELKGYLGDKRLFKSHTFLKHFTVKGRCDSMAFNEDSDQIYST